MPTRYPILLQHSVCVPTQPSQNKPVLANRLYHQYLLSLVCAGLSPDHEPGRVPRINPNLGMYISGLDGPALDEVAQAQGLPQGLVSGMCGCDNVGVQCVCVLWMKWHRYKGLPQGLRAGKWYVWVCQCRCAVCMCECGLACLNCASTCLRWCSEGLS